MDPVLQMKLLRLASRERRLRKWSLLGAWWLAVAFAGLVLFGVSRTTGWGSVYVPIGLALLAALGAFVLLCRSRVVTDWHHLALRIESAHPELEGRLLTLVRNAPGSGPLPNFFDQKLLREVLRHESVLDWSAVVPSARLRVAWLAQLLALVFVTFVCWLSWPQPKARQYPSEYPLWGVNVTPGDTAIEKGNALVVMARFGGTQPASVELVIGSTNSPQRVPLVRSLSDPLFGASLPQVESNFTYHISYSGRRTRDFNVRVFEFPRLEQADAQITYPQYTGLHARQIPDSRRISAVQGSRVNYSLRLNKPVVKAALIPRGGRGDRLDLATSGHPAATLEAFELASSATYDLLLVDSEGLTNKVPASFVFQALTNTAPELRFAAPRGDLRPTAIEEIPFEASVWDDFGVAEYGVGYQVVGHEMVYLSLGKDVPSKEKRTFTHLLSLEQFDLSADQVIAWFLWAEDAGPDGQLRRTTTDLFFGEVRPFEEVFREAQGGMAGQQQQQGGAQGEPQESATSKLAEVQKQILNATWKLQREQGRMLRSNTNPAPRESSRPASHRLINFTVLSTGPQVFGRPAEGPRRSSRARDDEPRLGARAQEPLPSDMDVLVQSQEEVIRQAKDAVQTQEDPRTAALWRSAIKDMETALERLRKARTSEQGLKEAVAAQQAAYQALLKLQDHEHQVARSQQNRGQSGGGRQGQMQRQLEQMELTQTENRYETQSQAQRPQSAERTEQLQVLNRLQELARRQQDVNERLKELQSALQEARTEQEREELKRQLKRLQEEQQEMLADVDELRQRMDASSNQSRMTEQRKQLEQAREDIQRAAEAASQGSPSQAAAAGSRAQSQLEQMRDELRKQSSGEFGEEMRQMRNEARQLAKEQEEILNRMQTPGAQEPRSLSDSGKREEALEALDEQRQRVTNLVQRATGISQEAETSEPLLSRQLHDAIRQFSQETAKDVREMQDQLLLRGMMTRTLMEQLRDSAKSDVTKLLDTTSEMLRMDLLPPARDAGSRAQTAFNQLRDGVERAAESVIGDDTEALRQAQETIDRLTEQLQAEMAREGVGTNITGIGGTNGGPRVGSARQGLQGQGEGTNNTVAAAGTRPDDQRNQGQNRSGAEREPGQASDPSQQAQAQAGDQSEPQTGGQGGRGDQRQQAGRPQASGGSEQADASQQPGDGRQSSSQGEQAPQGRGDGTPSSGLADNSRDSQGGGRNRGPRSGRDQLGGSRASGGAEGGDLTGGWQRAMEELLNDEKFDTEGGPIIGEGYAPWANQLRDVEEMVDQPELRNELSRVRDRARQMRQEFKRDRKKPDWAVVRLQLVDPLVQVRDQIADELARRGSREALVPVDRDPVPSKYSELVRRYYEQLGK